MNEEQLFNSFDAQELKQFLKLCQLPVDKKVQKEDFKVYDEYFDPWPFLSGRFLRIFINNSTVSDLWGTPVVPQSIAKALQNKVIFLNGIPFYVKTIATAKPSNLRDLESSERCRSFYSVTVEEI